MRKYKSLETILVALIIYFGFVYFLLQPKFGPQFESAGDRFDEGNQLDLNFENDTAEQSTIKQEELSEDQLAAFEFIMANHSLSDQVVIRSVVENDFGDTSLGCPESDLVYSEVITPGFMFSLENETGEILDYRISKDLSTFVNCSAIK